MWLQHNIRRKRPFFFLVGTQIIPPLYAAIQKHKAFRFWQILLKQLPPFPASPFLILPQSKKWDGEPGIYLPATSAHFTWTLWLPCGFLFAVFKLTWSFMKNTQTLRNKPHVCGFSSSDLTRANLKATGRGELNPWRLPTKGMENEKFLECSETEVQIFRYLVWIRSYKSAFKYYF